MPEGNFKAGKGRARCMTTCSSTSGKVAFKKQPGQAKYKRSLCTKIRPLSRPAVQKRDILSEYDQLMKQVRPYYVAQLQEKASEAGMPATVFPRLDDGLYQFLGEANPQDAEI